jgi:cytochrome c oxidase subunit 1
MLIFLANLVWSLALARRPAVSNPWQSRGLEWQVPTPVPLENFDEVPTILAGPYEYGDAQALPVARLGGGPIPATAGD